MTLTFGSLFAGIGGFDLGFERAGMTCKWQVEIDDYANRVLAKHWPNVHRERDIRECGKHNLEPVDVICGGFPCQDISYAGLGKGLDGARSGLFFEAIRLVRELRPRIVVLENVAALLTRGLDRVLGTLAESGFDSEWGCLPAAAVGAPHIRDRVFILAYCENTHVQKVLSKNTSLRTQWPKRKFRGTDGMYQGDQRWAPESNLVRVVDGVPAEVDRLRGLGNAVVPQVAEWIGRRIVEASLQEATP
jgi:DNA (cytosine-5)-methyltransferase 1